MTTAAELQDYEVSVAREINGAWRTKGETVHLTAGQARYYLEPMGRGLIRKPAASKKKTDKTADAA